MITVNQPFMRPSHYLLRLCSISIIWGERMQSYLRYQCKVLSAIK